MGDYVYAFSALGVTIHSTSDLNPIQELDIPGHELPDWYYYEEDDVENQNLKVPMMERWSLNPIS